MASYILDLTPLTADKGERVLLRPRNYGQKARTQVNVYTLTQTDNSRFFCDNIAVYDEANKHVSRTTGMISWPAELYAEAKRDENQKINDPDVQFAGIHNIDGTGLDPNDVKFVVHVPANVRLITPSFVHGLLEQYVEKIVPEYTDDKRPDTILKRWHLIVDDVVKHVRSRIRISVASDSDWTSSLIANFDAGLVEAVDELYKRRYPQNNFEKEKAKSA